jgi:anthranilate phosphoribosyltransferase
MVLANAAMALVAADASKTLEEGVEVAAGAIDSGRAEALLQAFVTCSNGG